MERKRHITIKGHRNGIAIHFNPRSGVDEVLGELEATLQEMEPPSGEIALKLHAGTRYLDEELSRQIREVVARHGVFYIEELSSEVMLTEEAKATYGKKTFHYHSGTIRSGQVLSFEGSVLIIGDVNPGSEVRATGSIYCLGTIRGNVRAGVEGWEDAVITASLLHPLFLAIGEHVLTPDDDTEMPEIEMGCAYQTNHGIEMTRLRQVMSGLKDAYAMELQRG
ncbi:MULTISPECIES: septum site-determining protein MinC [unclassified Exiguobacterium]|uniref:septum site-determining protein MinC n=1 Tax=unclassified Exiguobacterium TaxID=2644629 RepID=UPI001F273905|nr:MULTISPECIES: septum site-determining protein MinC [unclassified Exiguobacterium]